MTKNVPEIQNAYKELWAFNNCEPGKSTFRSFLMKGSMRKKVQEKSMFSLDSYPKRYFICDFTRATVTIAYRPDSIDSSSTHKIAFREFLEVVEFTSE